MIGTIREVAHANASPRSAAPSDDVTLAQPTDVSHEPGGNQTDYIKTSRLEVIASTLNDDTLSGLVNQSKYAHSCEAPCRRMTDQANRALMSPRDVLNIAFRNSCGISY